MNKFMRDNLRKKKEFLKWKKLFYVIKTFSKEVLGESSLTYDIKA